MGCACKNKQADQAILTQVNELENVLALTDTADYTKLPTEHCAMCAEKHYATAYALAFETGYESANTQSAVDELVCAIWHMASIDRDIAMDMAGIKRMLMVHAVPNNEDWTSVADRLYAKVNSLFDLEDKTSYDPVQLYRIIGELVCSGWHANNINDKTLAANIRVLRHRLQHRETPIKEDWLNVMSQAAAMLDKELTAEAEEQQSEILEPEVIDSNK